MGNWRVVRMILWFGLMTMLLLQTASVMAASVPPLVTDLIIGFSTEGRPITAVRIGNGPRKLVLVGATHGGPEANTYRLVTDLVDHFRAHPEEVPSSVRLYLIPILNPDGMARNWRFNANDIDLNRNMNTNLDACPENDWSRTVNGARGLVSDTGGNAPETEVESRLIRDFLLDASAAIFYHSAGGELFPAFCNNEPSIRLAQAYAAASGYQYMRYYPRYHITGGMHDWAGSMGIASFTPELWNGDDSDTEINHTAIHTVLDEATELLPLPKDRVEAGVAVPAAIWRYWRSHGGNELFGPPLAPVQSIDGQVIQYFERAIIVLNPRAADTSAFIELAPLDQRIEQDKGSVTTPALPDVQARLSAFWEQWGGSTVFGAAQSSAIVDAKQGRVVQIFARAELEYILTNSGAQVRLAPVGWRAWQRQQIIAPTLVHQIR